MSNIGQRIGLAVALVTALSLSLTGCSTESDLPVLDFSERLEAVPATPVAPDRERKDYFLFGFDPRASLVEDTHQYLPFLDYLQRETGYRFKLHFSGALPIAEELGHGLVDFAAIGAASFIRARETHTVLPLVRGLNSHGRAEYRSKIVVRPDGPLRGLEQLRGARFAFGDANSTQGHLIPRIVLSEHGIELADLASYAFTGSHRACAQAVVSYAADACGMQDVMADSLERQGLVRVLYTSRFYPSSGIAANPRVPPAALERVREALLDFDPTGRDGSDLYHWEQTEMPLGFTAAALSDYTDLRAWMVRLSLIIPTQTPQVAGHRH